MKTMDRALQETILLKEFPVPRKYWKVVVVVAVGGVIFLRRSSMTFC